MQGKIIKGIAGFYYVDVAESEIGRAHLNSSHSSVSRMPSSA